MYSNRVKKWLKEGKLELGMNFDQMCSPWTASARHYFPAYGGSQAN
jgi:hypothetical protein